MTIQITLGNNKSITVKKVNSFKLRALRSLHGTQNIKLMFDYDLSTMSW